jgi:hypothetical protein
MSRKSSKSKSKGKRRSIFVSPFVLLALLPLIAAVLFARTGSLDRILTVWRNLGKTPESKSAQREETRKREPLKKKRRADERIRPDGTKPSGVAASTGHASEAVVRAGVDASGSVVDALDDPDDETTACDDKQDVCKFWAEIGECETNPGYMKVWQAKPQRPNHPPAARSLLRPPACAHAARCPQALCASPPCSALRRSIAPKAARPATCGTTASAVSSTPLSCPPCPPAR